MHVVVLGLGRMGAGVAARLLAAGCEVSVWNRTPEKEGSFLAAGAHPFRFTPPSGPRVYWLALPAGEATAEVLAKLSPLLTAGDVVCDAANAPWEDAATRVSQVQPASYLDVGISGGVTGRDNGYALMVGGEDGVVRRLAPLWQAVTGDARPVRVGAHGAGHFSKMLHNAVEYGMLQAIGEGYELLRNAPVALDSVSVVATWKNGSIVSGYLVDRLMEVVQADPSLTTTGAQVDQTGEGARAHAYAETVKIPDAALQAALEGRARSQQDDRLQYRVIAALRKAFGGHSVYTPKQ